jgi:hypothetical protein
MTWSHRVVDLRGAKPCVLGKFLRPTDHTSPSNCHTLQQHCPYTCMRRNP